MTGLGQRIEESCSPLLVLVPMTVQSLSAVPASSQFLPSTKTSVSHGRTVAVPLRILGIKTGVRNVPAAPVHGIPEVQGSHVAHVMPVVVKATPVHPRGSATGNTRAAQGDEDLVAVRTLPTSTTVCLRVAYSLLLAMTVFVPAQSYETTDVGAVVYGTLAGIASVLTITVMTLRVHPGKHMHTQTYEHTHIHSLSHIRGHGHT